MDTTNKVNTHTESIALESLSANSYWEEIRKYFIEKIKNPDKDSDFDLLTQPLRSTQEEHIRIPALLSNGYRVYFLRNKQGETPVVKGFIAFQIHDDIAKVFRFEVEEQYRGNQLSVVIAKSLIDIFQTNPQIKRLKIGKWPVDTSNPDDEAVKLIKRLKDNSLKDNSLKDNSDERYTVDESTHIIER